MQEGSSNSTITLQPVTMGKRFMHLLVDTIIINIAATQLNSILHIIPEVSAPVTTMQQMMAPQFMRILQLQAVATVVMNIVYYFPLEAFSHGTFGKLLTDSRVIKLNGLKITPMDALLRAFCRCIPFNGLSFLFTNGIGWHDTITKTRVVTKTDWQKLVN
jgi:uncharacterized RDD family membrane protein YckC